MINRIIEQSKPGGVKRLQDAILKETLVPLTAVMCKSAGITADRILRAAVASNTTMNHLLLGVDADPVRMEPYIPTFFQWRGMVAKDLGFVANPDAEVLPGQPGRGNFAGAEHRLVRWRRYHCGHIRKLNLEQGRILTLY